MLSELHAAATFAHQLDEAILHHADVSDLLKLSLVCMSYQGVSLCRHYKTVLFLTLQHVKCRRLQQDNASVGAVGTACTLGPTCNSLNVSCKITAATAITDAGTSLSGLNVLQSGCLLLPDAGSNVSLPSIVSDLDMDSLFQMLVVTEDTLYPTPNRKGCASASSQTVSCYLQ